MRYRHRPAGGKGASLFFLQTFVLRMSVPQLRAGIDCRDHDFECRSLSRGAIDQDVASPTPDSVQRQEQTEAGAALAEAEKGLKDFLTVFGGKPASFISDANVHRITALGRNNDLAARLRCLNRVEQKIDEQVLQLGLVRPHMQRRCERAYRNFYGTGAGCRTDKLLGGGDSSIQVHDISGMPLSARQAQEVLSNAAAAQDLFARDRRIVTNSGLIHWPTLSAWGFAEDALHAHQGGCQRRVHLVRKPRGQHSNRRQAVRLGQLRLGRSPFGDVAPDFYYLSQPARGVQNR